MYGDSVCIEETQFFQHTGKYLNFQCQQKRIVTKLIYDQLPTKFQTAHVDVDTYYRIKTNCIQNSRKK